MALEVEVLAVHGWGFDRECWDPLRALLPAGTTLRAYDRGYLGRPTTVGWSRPGAARRVLLLHSMAPLYAVATGDGAPGGDAAIAGDFFAEADALVLVSSFVRFPPSGRVLRRMRERLADEAGAVLREFHERSGLRARDMPSGPGADRSSRAPAAEPDVVRLAADLDLLDRGESPIADMDGVPERIVIHGDQDEIVPEEFGRELALALGEGIVYRSVRGAGHALPVTHPEAVIDAILPAKAPVR